MAKNSRIFRKIVQARPYGFWPGFWLGFLYFGWIFSWFWSLHLVNLYGIENSLESIVLIFIPYIVTITVMAAFWGIFSAFTFKLTKSDIYGNIALPIVMAGIFVLLEYSRAWFFGILWLGKESLIGAHWTFGNLAYLFSWFKPALWLSAYTGIYGIDFLIVLLAASLILASKDSRYKKCLLWEFFLVLSLILLIYINRPQDKNANDLALKVSVIQTRKPTQLNSSSRELLRDLEIKNNLLKEAASNSNLVVFPEGADFSKSLLNFLDPNSVRKYFSNLSQNNILIADNNRITDQGQQKSRTILVESKNGIAGYYDKKLLTPGGEFLPYIVKGSLFIFRFSLNKIFEESREFSRGTTDNVLNYQENKVEILACSDVISPNLSRAKGADFIIAQNSDGIFNGNQQIQNQLLSMSRFRAAENGKYLVFASNFGLSYILNNQGNIDKIASSPGYQILTETIIPNKKSTWYNKLGDWSILLFSSLVLVWHFLAFKRVYKN